MTPVAQQLEALLLVAGESVALADLAEAAHVTPQVMRAALDELVTNLQDHGITVVISATHAHLVTAPAVASFVQQFIQTEESTLSKAAAETLALVAYRGPISRLEIDTIRGVDSRRMLRQLMARGLVARTVSRSGAPTYHVTELFLEQLGLHTTSELPDFAALSQQHEAP